MYTPPKLTDLIKRTKGDFDNVGIKSLLIDAIAMAHAGQSNGLYEFLAWISRQIVPHLADDEILLLFCQFWGVQRKVATKATGDLTVTLQGEAVIPAKTQWQTEDGFIVENPTSAILKAGTATIPVEAVVDGAAGNREGDLEFSLISPIINLENRAMLSKEGMTTGADIESINSLRARLLFRVQYPPSGGNKWDYIRWARECAGVTRAWCIPAPMYANYVTVLFVLDDQPSILPTKEDIARVADYIDGHLNPITNQWEGKPSAAELILTAPKIKKINPVIKLYPDTIELRSAVKDALVQLLQNLQLGEKIYLSQLRATISNVKGVVDHVVVAPKEDIDAAYDELVILGDVTWQ
ncbi:baseplate J/gp47 family protein [Orbaceae bacterium ESL0721]|nr:baseplate J/gp47 family protein [Orbaceae bacterium ESL0721]